MLDRPSHFDSERRKGSLSENKAYQEFFSRSIISDRRGGGGVAKLPCSTGSGGDGWRGECGKSRLPCREKPHCAEQTEISWFSHGRRHFSRQIDQLAVGKRDTALCRSIPPVQGVFLKNTNYINKL